MNTISMMKNNNQNNMNNHFNFNHNINQTENGFLKINSIAPPIYNNIQNKNLLIPEI